MPRTRVSHVPAGAVPWFRFVRNFLGCLVCLLFLPLASVAQPAGRVVSLDLCTDWMLARYADRAQVAALSPIYSQYPVAWLPGVSLGEDIHALAGGVNKGKTVRVGVEQLAGQASDLLGRAEYVGGRAVMGSFLFVQILAQRC